MSKKSFIVYNSFYEPLKDLSDEDFGQLFKAVFEYHISGKYKLPKHLIMAFNFLKIQFDMDIEKYKNISEMRSQFARKGGKAKATKRQHKLPKAAVDVDDDVDDDDDDDDDDVVIIKDTNLKKIVDHYNQVFEKDIRSTAGFEKNFNLWKKVHNTEKILTAINNARQDKFWKDKMTLQVLFRQKNTRGEDVDYIETLSNATKQLSGIAFL